MNINSCKSDFASNNLQVSNRYETNLGNLLTTLKQDLDSHPCDHSIYLCAKSLMIPEHVNSIIGKSPLAREMIKLIHQVGNSDTGIASFWWNTHVLVIIPPFPISKSLYSIEPDTTQLTELSNKNLQLGIILLRLGQYAVGIINGSDLIAAKSGSRYVKNRHRAGGSSQRRFERSRERLIKELFDKTCQVTSEVMGPFYNKIDYLLMGGDKNTLKRFTRHCLFTHRLKSIILSRTLEVHRPGRKALEKIKHQVWNTKVIVFKRKE